MNIDTHSSRKEPKFRIAAPHFRVPTLQGIIDRRMLVNFRCDAGVLARMLPPPFRPKKVNGWGMAGICLIRLRDIRPARLPGTFGLTSENAAHRIAVEWDDGGEVREGVFIPRRDTSLMLNRLAGGWLFPARPHVAEFRVDETVNHFKLEMQSADGVVAVQVLASVADTLPKNSVFHSLEEASAFFKTGGLGWSPRESPGEFDGLELHCPEWRMESLAVERVESSFFSNADLFPPGTAIFDSAFLMRNLAHEWRARGKMIADPL